MGYTHVTVAVSNLQKSKPPYTTSFLVDTGAIVCLAPSAELSKAGIEAEGREAYELANGAPAEYDYGFARLSFMGSDTVTKIIFGPDGVEPLLGVTALESVGIGVDPVTQTLKRDGALPLKAQHSTRDGAHVGESSHRQDLKSLISALPKWLQTRARTLTRKASDGSTAALNRTDC